MRARHLLIILGVVVAVLVLPNLDALQNKARQTIASAAGKAAVTNMSGVVSDNNARGIAAAELITLPIEVDEVAPGVFRASGVGNTFVITTSEGNVIFDTGLVIQASEQIRQLKTVLGDFEPVKIVLSHSHADHVGGTRLWSGENTELIAHEEFEEEQRYLTELNPYLHQRNRTLFPWIPETPRTLPGMDFRGLIPDVRVDNDIPYSFTLGGRRFEVHATPGAEGADNVVLWLPDDKVLLTGDFFGPQFPQFPNLFTMRGEKMRKPVEYMNSIDHLLNLEIETLLPSHLEPVRGANDIRAGMIKIREAVDFVHSATVSGMNAGTSLSELMVEIRLPERLLLSETHGKVSWAVKSIWEYYATWFHFDRTSELYATPQSAVLDDLAGIIDADAALSLVREKLQRNEPEQALLLLELFEGFDTDPELMTLLMELRVEVLSQLRERATVTGNDYELYWLDSELEKARGALP
ncbi:MAG: MBL fold metallo-hydrolase [Luminiphilus sp.]|jgi:glyoxylase-like metal-dependent hydrolase (beta-lactamase superfamily II)